MSQLILFNLFNGLIVGAFYALMALGLSLILNLSGVINFAHGGFLALGAYIAYTLMPYTGFWGALAHRAGAHGDRRPHRRAPADPAALRARSALQPAAHLRPRLRPRGRRALHLGRAERAVPDPGMRSPRRCRRSTSSSRAIASSWWCSSPSPSAGSSTSSTARAWACASARARWTSRRSPRSA